MCARKFSSSCFVTCNKFRVLRVSFVSIRAWECQLPSFPPLADTSPPVAPPPSPDPTWNSKASPQRLERAFLPVWSKPNVIVISKPLLSCLGRMMLSLLLWCLFNKYVVIICLWKWPLWPLLNFLHGFCCKQTLSCVCSLHSPTLVCRWRCAGDSFCFYAIMLCVYFSEMSTHQQRMMLKIIQINSFLFLLIRPSPVSWMTVNRTVFIWTLVLACADNVG